MKVLFTFLLMFLFLISFSEAQLIKIKTIDERYFERYCPLMFAIYDACSYELIENYFYHVDYSFLRDLTKW